MSISIRPQRERDREAIWEVTRLAFEGQQYADGDEQDLIDTLRRIGALSVSLVAIDGNDLVGQITFSPAGSDGTTGDWYSLGPVSVHPDRQGEGIGGALIEAGMKAIQALGAAGSVLTGDPGYYARHGFVLSPAHRPDNESAENFMLRTIGNARPAGKFSFHEAFYAVS